MINRSHRSAILLTTILTLDIVLITLHFLHRLAYRGILHSDFLINHIFSMSEEGQLPDLFKYLKQFGIVILLIYLATQRKRLYAIWAAIFGYLLVDDIAEIHERIGYALQDKVPQIATIDPADVAQSGYLVLVAMVLFGVSLWIIWRSQGKDRQASIHLMLLLAVAAFFGVFVDIFQGLVMNVFGISGIVKVIEDGGEMLIMSVILWYVYRFAFETIPNINLSWLLPSRIRHTVTQSLSNNFH